MAVTAIFKAKKTEMDTVAGECFCWEYWLVGRQTSGLVPIMLQNLSWKGIGSSKKTVFSDSDQSVLHKF